MRFWWVTMRFWWVYVVFYEFLTMRTHKYIS